MYICGQSPKLHYICKLLLKHVYERDEKLVIWYEHPVKGWLVCMLLSVLCIESHFIGSNIVGENRQSVFTEWNNPEHPVKVLVCSAKCAGAGAGVNMQKGSHVAIMLTMC